MEDIVTLPRRDGKFICLSVTFFILFSYFLTVSSLLIPKVMILLICEREMHEEAREREYNANGRSEYLLIFLY